MRRGSAKDQLEHLHRKQGGLCRVCGEAADLAVATGPEAPCRFRVRSSYGAKGRVRPKVMAHRKCAQKRSDEIQNSIDPEIRRERSGAFPLNARELSDVLYRLGRGERQDHDSPEVNPHRK